MNQNQNWIPVTGSAIGALAGGLPGALIGGIIGAIIKEFICPNCGRFMKDEGKYYRCQHCGCTVLKK